MHSNCGSLKMSMYLYKLTRRILTHRKRRIRKKYRIGEFTEWGFNVTATLVDGATEDEFRSVLDGLIEQIERRKLCCGGGCDRRMIHLYVATTRRCTSATESDRAEIREWLLTQKEIASVTVYNLTDAWSSED